MDSKISIDIRKVKGQVDKRIYGQFIEHLGRCIYGGIWVGEDSQIPNIEGYRKDVLEAIKAIAPTVVRWPGGNFSSGYHFEDGIGPRDKRPIRYDLAWGVEESNQFGTDEFIRWCNLVGAEPFIVVNAGNGSPEEAARWVEYCNRKGKSYYAALRAKYGHAEPYGVKLWGIGNEAYGSWQIGFAIDPKDFAKRTIEFSNEMKKVDSSIELVAVGSGNPEWDIEMVKTAGNWFDYLSIHRYDNPYSMSYYEYMALQIEIENWLREIYRNIKVAEKLGKIHKNIKISFDEWNIWYPEAKPVLHHQVTSVKDGLYTAMVLNSLHRLYDIVSISTFAQTVNVLPLIYTSDDGSMFVNPQYLAFKLFSQNKCEKVLEVTLESPKYKSSKFGEVPYLDVTASYENSSGKVCVYIVNRNEKESLSCEIHLNGSYSGLFQLSSFSGESPEDKNSFDEPNKVTITSSNVEKFFNGKITLNLNPHSVNVVSIFNFQ